MLENPRCFCGSRKTGEPVLALPRCTEVLPPCFPRQNNTERTACYREMISRLRLEAADDMQLSLRISVRWTAACTASCRTPQRLHSTRQGW